MNQAFHLVRLQKIDLQIDQINNRIREIERLLKENSSVQIAEKTVSEAQAAVKKADANLKKCEDEVEGQRIKIEMKQASLYSGKIHNPKELQDLQNDIASLKRRLVTLEDEQLNAMQVGEDLEEQVKKVSTALLQTQAQFIAQTSDLAGEKTRLTDNLQRLTGERDAALLPLVAESISIYQRLRTQKRGLAVAVMEDGACTACGSELRPEEAQAARSPNNIVYCSSCGRILYSG
jgi:uncharacterized protein